MRFATPFSARLLHFMSFALLLSLAAGCQRPVQQDATEQEDAPMVMGQDAKGNKVLYGVSCLRQNAAAIKEGGQSAARRCIVKGVSKTEYDRGVRGTSTLQYTYLYYPYANCWYPPYWGGSNTGYGNASPSNYYNGYNNFCVMIFGNSWGNSNNCISNVFGWTGNYSNYSNTTTSCYQCQYVSNPSSCYQSRGCWTSTSYNYYYSPYSN